MKRLLLLLLLVSTVFTMPTFNLTEESYGYSAQITVPSLKLSTIELADLRLNFQKITLDDYGFCGEIGSPQLPVGVFDISFSGATPEVSAQNIVADTITLNSPIYPVQTPMPYGVESTKSDYNRSLYVNSTTPIVTLGDIYEIRGVQGAQIVINPVKYLPLENRVVVIKSFTLRVNTRKTRNVNSTGSSTFDKLVVSNFKNIKTVTTRKRGEKEDYLVIAADRYKDNSDLNRFVSFRNEHYNVKLSYLSDVGSSQSAIKSYIKQENPSYLLFVGDYNDFPAYNGKNLSQYGGGAGYIKTYLDYIDGGDGRPDIALGLFFVRTNTALKNIVDKTINNQRNLGSMGMGYLCMGGHNRIGSAPMTASHIDEIFDGLTEDYWNPIGFDLKKVYANSGAHRADVKYAIQELNKGVRFFNYNGHGLQTGWNFTQNPENLIWGSGSCKVGTTSGGTVTISKQLDEYGTIKNTVNPFVISCACLTGQFKHTENCWAETMIGNRYLATTVIASSEISFGNQHALNAYLMKAIKDQNITTIGDMFVYAITKTYGTNLYPNFGASSMADVGAQEYHLFGDPACETMKTLDPVDFVRVTYPNGNETLIPGETYNITWESSASNIDIKLMSGGSLVSTLATNVSGNSWSWSVPQDISENSNYTINVESGNLSDISDENFTIKKVKISKNICDYGDWWVACDSNYTGVNKSTATLDLSKQVSDTIVGGSFEIGVSGTEKENIWPWGNLSTSPNNTLDGVTEVQLTYRSASNFLITLDQIGLDEDGVQYGFSLPPTSTFKDTTILISQFAQPEWAKEDNKVADLKLEDVEVISFSPNDLYGKSCSIEVKRLKLLGFKGEKDPVANAIVLKHNPSSLKVLGVNQGRISLSVPKDGNYRLSLISPTGRVLFSSSKSLRAGIGSFSFNKSNFSSQIVLVAISGEGFSDMFREILTK